MTHRMFVAFAGGGAKALIHLGALRALEAKGVDFRGLSGTSAGALVATLKASGFSADELLNPLDKSSVISRLGEIRPSIKQAKHLFGRWGWWKVWLFRTAMPMLPTILCVSLVSVALTLILVGALLAWGRIYLAAAIFAALIIFLGCVATSLLSGLARSREFSEALGILLQQRMFPSETGRVVRMGDFGRDGRPILKIVSANLTTGKMELFSPERTPNVPVADAVAASISLPIIFEPLIIDENLHMDGGIVSNLPAWSFDEERELDPDAITLAIEIQTATERRILNRLNWMGAFIQTGLFGSSELNLRAAGQAERLELSTSLHLLEFDLSIDRAIKEVLDAETAATAKLDKWLFQTPETYAEACRFTKGLVDDVIEAALDQRNPKVRVAIAIPDVGHTRSLRLRYSTGYEGHHDERMLIPIDGTVAGQAWKTGDSWFELAPLSPEFSLMAPEHRLRRKALRSDLKWVLCIPISIGDGPVRFVVQIDGGRDLPEDETVGTMINSIETDVKEFFGMLADRFKEMEE
ncbi:patatin-like phospholipase family protein [Agrobacterium radiobacter]|uniref:patatin-like phospholipase family protein n=1 Tax=Agrobacterium radiobacter TaxID=362 RepID=UPI003438D7AF